MYVSLHKYTTMPKNIKYRTMYATLLKYAIMPNHDNILQDTVDG